MLGKRIHSPCLLDTTGELGVSKLRPRPCEVVRMMRREEESDALCSYRFVDYLLLCTRLDTHVMH